MKSFPSCLHIVGPVLLLLALVSFTGCAKHQEAATSTPAEAQAALQQAFSQAKPEVKTAADEAAAAIQNQPGKALLQLQAISSSPDLDPQQRNAAQNSIFALTARLRAAAAQGDPEAEKALQAYRSAR